MKHLSYQAIRRRLRRLEAAYQPLSEREYMLTVWGTHEDYERWCDEHPDIKLFSTFILPLKAYGVDLDQEWEGEEPIFKLQPCMSKRKRI